MSVKIVSKKSNRWIVNLIIALGIVALLGWAILPFWNVAKETAGVNSAITPASVQDNSLDREQLEAQAKGYELVVQREPENETALRGLLETKLKLNDLPGSIEALEKLVALKPEQRDYAILLAQAKQQNGDREGAAAVYRQILAAEPGNIKALQGLVNLLLVENSPEAAIGLLSDTLNAAEKSNQIQPGSVNEVSVRVILGEVYASLGRYAEAIATYNEATIADPQDFRPVLGKAIVFQQQGKLEEASPLFASATQLAPSQYRDRIQELAKAPEPPSSEPSAEPSAEPSTEPPNSEASTEEVESEPEISE